MESRVVIVVLIVALVASLVGLCIVGYQFYQAQGRIDVLVESIRERDKLDIKLANDLKQLNSDNTKLRSNLSELRDINEKRQANDREALRLLSTATHQ
jgi:biopolymer transport protein ExbB/TolQ